MYQISTFAKLSSTSIPTLRYYDNLDLLKPQLIGKFNNYRYYAKEQLITIEQIKVLKQMGLKLLTIKKILNNYDEQYLINHCNLLKAEVKAQEKTSDQLELIIKRAQNNGNKCQKELINLINDEERSIDNMKEKYQATKAKLITCYELYQNNDLPGCFELLEELKNDIFVANDQFEPFWNQSAGDLFTGIAFEIIKKEKPADVSFLNIYKFKVQGQDVIDNLAPYVDQLDKDSYSYLCLSGISAAPMDTRMGIIAFFKQKLKTYAMYDVNK